MHLRLRLLCYQHLRLLHGHHWCVHLLQPLLLLYGWPASLHVLRREQLQLRCLPLRLLRCRKLQLVLRCLPLPLALLHRQQLQLLLRCLPLALLHHSQLQRHHT